MKLKKRYFAYAACAALAISLLIWAHYDPPYMAELKKTTPVESATEEPLAVVADALEAVKTQNRQQLFQLMLIKDSTEFQRYAGILQKGGELFPTETAGCRKLVNSHRSDNVSVYIYSHPRRKTYQFTLLRDTDGQYRIRSISLARQRP